MSNSVAYENGLYRTNIGAAADQIHDKVTRVFAAQAQRKVEARKALVVQIAEAIRSEVAIDPTATDEVKDLTTALSKAYWRDDHAEMAMLIVAICKEGLKKDPKVEAAEACAAGKSVEAAAEGMVFMGTLFADIGGEQFIKDMAAYADAMLTA